MSASSSAALGLNIFLVLALILVSQRSMDSLPGEMHTTYVKLHMHTALCTPFQGFVVPLKRLQGLWIDGQKFGPYARVYPFNLHLLQMQGLCTHMRGGCCLEELAA